MGFLVIPFTRSKWVSADTTDEHPLKMAAEAWMASRESKEYRRMSESAEKSES